MIYRSTEECVLDLEKHGYLIRVREEVDPYLEMAEIHRRVNQAGGPAILFERVKGSRFPAVSNLYGTEERCRFIFRHTLDQVKKIIRLKAEPAQVLRHPVAALFAGIRGMNALPLPAFQSPVSESECRISDLPQIVSWPGDGGPFILLPQVYTEDPDQPGVLHSNLGMYRIQMAGNEYLPDQEMGLHYQIRRDIGIHHTHALRRGEALRVSVFVGGPPAHAFAAVMYLPEGMSELVLAGMLAGRNFRFQRKNGFLISSDADFVITGWVDPQRTKPEGPFGDHLGYYSLKHSFPVMRVEKIYHRRNAIWPFTVVGRPPQEDSVFGKMVQELAGPMIPKEIPGIKAVHAVDETGVHPLLLAIGSERYTPYDRDRRPQEILTLAHALLGYGPCSLAKYLLIVAGEDDPALNVADVQNFFRHLLERIDWKKDLHFQTATTMDTLDYSGTGLNQGSKVVLAAAGPKIRGLAVALPSSFQLPEGYSRPRLVAPGIMVISGNRFLDYESADAEMRIFSRFYEQKDFLSEIPLIVVVDDSDFAARNFANFLWVAFTRSNPSHDLYGIDSFQKHKHWGCHGPLIIDARIKPHHTATVEPDPAVARAVEALAVKGKSLHQII